MELLEQIRAAGIVGCGGAGFPTHAKLNCKVDTLIVNGAECEPLLRTDRWLMRHMARQVVTAAALCGAQVGASRILIAVKETYETEQDALTEAISRLGSPVALFLLQNYYPAGDEQMLVLDVTGKTVPPGGIPLDVGAVVCNVATLCAVYDAVRGEPFTQKYLTVTGAVGEPAVVRVPIGTPFAACIQAAGGTQLADYRILSGGPLMGKLYTPQQAEHQVVTKTTSGLVVLPGDIPLVRQRETPLEAILRRAKTTCVQCTHCTELCPRHLAGHPLMPHRIMRKLAGAQSPAQLIETDLDLRQALTCSECGVCEVFACPMGLQPRQVNVWVKGLLRQAGVKLTRAEAQWAPAIERQWRRAPSKRMATRLGVAEWYSLEIDRLVSPLVHRVELPLAQHIGAPARPIVAVGEMVTRGQTIALCPDGALGANLSASIAGTITSVTDRITIEGGSR